MYKRQVKGLVVSLERVEKQMAGYGARIAEAVHICGSTLPQLQGSGNLLAGKILAEAPDVSRFTTADRFAAMPALHPWKLAAEKTANSDLTREATIASTPTCTSWP